MADGFSTTSLSQRIDRAVGERAMLSHPFYRAWSAGELTLDTLRAYARQYYHHVEAFPRAVSAVYAACPDRGGRRMLAENLAEEEGLGEGRSPHAELWMQFAEGLGCSRDAVETEALTGEAQALIDTFQTLTRRSYAAGLGALYAYESQLPAVSSTKIEGLERFYGIADPAAQRFFRVHESADVEHAAVCRDLLDRLPLDQQQAALDGADELAAALQGFLNGVDRITAGARPH